MGKKFDELIERGMRYDAFREGFEFGASDETDDPDYIFPSHMEWDLKRDAPYSYRPFYVWGGKDKRCNGSVYHDRMQGWDNKKIEQISLTIWEPRESLFDKGTKYAVTQWKDHVGMQKLLREFNDDPTLELTAIVEYCNLSNGYPVWRFDYISTKRAQG